MPNNRERQSLDNYITGHYGEDQFRGMYDAIQDDMTGHEWAFLTNVMSDVYMYDPAEDGPEVEAIKAIVSMHGEALLLSEHSAYLFSRRRRKVSYAR